MGWAIRHVFNAIAIPRANGQVERQNRTIISDIGTSTECESLWDEKLCEMVWEMNHCVNTVVAMWRTCQVLDRNQLRWKVGASSQEIQQAVEACAGEGS